MKQLPITYYIVMSFLCIGLFGFSQEENAIADEEMFSIRGNVRESDTGKPISKVSVQVNGGAYTTTNIAGDFKIQAAIEDELIIRHDDFETVYHIIKSTERITVEVQPAVKKKISKYQSRSTSVQEFKILIDSAQFYKKKDASKSIKFIENAIIASNSVAQQAQAYEVLADVFMELEQYDFCLLYTSPSPRD